MSLQQPTTIAKLAAAASPASTRILVLEDNPTDVLLVKRHLRNHAVVPVEIRTAEQLSEALELLRTETFDVGLVDLNVPDSAGVETFERIHAAAPLLPVIVFTGQHDDEVSARILRGGAQDCIVKQVDIEDRLNQAIRFAIERNQAQREFKLQQARLERNEKQLRQIIEANADAMLVVDRGGIVRLVNPAAEELFGRSRQELVGKDLGFPLVASGAVDIDIVRRDRTTAVAEMRLVEMVWEEEKVFLASLRDFTARKQKALRMQAELASLSAEIGLALAQISLTLTAGLELVMQVLVRFCDISSARVWMLAEGGNELHLAASAGVPRLTAVRKDSIPLGKFKVGRIAQTGENEATNDLQNDPDVRDLDWVSRNCLVSFAGYTVQVDNKCIGVLVVFGRSPFEPVVLQALTSASRRIGQYIRRKRDEENLIRAKEEAERNALAIRESSEQLNLALRASGTGIWIWNAVDQTVVWDDRTHEMFGYAPGTFGGTWAHLTAALHPEDRDSLSRVIFNASLPSNVDVETEFRILRPDGQVRNIASRGRAYHDADGRLQRIVVTAQDITDHRLLEEKLRQSQKMEAIGQLAGGIAHDFNNILNIILGYSSMILKSTAPEDPTHRKVKEIRTAGERAAGLTRQMLAFSRNQILQPRVLHLGNTLQDMDHMVRRVIGEDVEVHTTVDPDLGNVKVDPSQIGQVILNLVVNARDAMPDGGKLTLGAANRVVDGSYSKSHNLPAGRYVVLEASDTGCGMPTEVQDRAFEPFFTTKEVGKGTGLGLATVYGIVQQSGGHIQLYSEVGVGTSFKIFLPRVDEAGEPLPEEIAAPPGKGETILVVEDDNAVRAQVVEVLGSVGYRVIEAADGEIATRLAQEFPGKIHLLLTDVVMPKMKGPEVAKRLTAARPGLKVIFMSGYTRNAVLIQADSGPEINLIEKPFTPEQLCDTIRGVIDSSPRSAVTPDAHPVS